MFSTELAVSDKNEMKMWPNQNSPSVDTAILHNSAQVLNLVEKSWMFNTGANRGSHSSEIVGSAQFIIVFVLQYHIGEGFPTRFQYSIPRHLLVEVHTDADI